MKSKVLIGGALATAMMAASAANAVPVVIEDLGPLLAGDTVRNGSIGANEVIWYSFTLGTAGYLDIDTNGSNGDTEIGLYSDAGNRIANDDDDGVGLDSVLSFGTGSGLALGDAFNLGGNGLAEGEDGALGPGTYFLALGEFNVIFNDTGFDAVSTGFDTGLNYTLTFRTDVAPIPLPAALPLLAFGIGGLVVVGRRKKTA